MEHVSSLSSLLPGNIFLTWTSTLSLTSPFWEAGKPAGHLASGQEGQQGRETFFFFDVTLCYSWVTGHTLL